MEQSDEEDGDAPSAKLSPPIPPMPIEASSPAEPEDPELAAAGATDPPPPPAQSCALVRRHLARAFWNQTCKKKGKR